jgi:hypothetical protein
VKVWTLDISDRFPGGPDQPSNSGYPVDNRRTLYYGILWDIELANQISTYLMQLQIRCVTVVFVLCLFAVESPVDAQYRQQMQPQNKPDIAIYLDGGVTNPVGPDAFNESWNVGYNMGTGIAFRLNERMMLRPRFSYNNFSLNGAAVPDTIEVSPSVLENGQYSTMAASLELLVELEYNPFVLKPFFIIGGGYFRGESSNLDGLTEDVDLGIRSLGQGRAALRGGVGLRAPINDFLSAFGEAKIVTGFTGDFGVMYAPISLGAMVRF